MGLYTVPELELFLQGFGNFATHDPAVDLGHP